MTAPDRLPLVDSPASSARSSEALIDSSEKGWYSTPFSDGDVVAGRGEAGCGMMVGEGLLLILLL